MLMMELSPCWFAILHKMTFFLIKELGLITKESSVSFFIDINRKGLTEIRKKQKK